MKKTSKASAVLGFLATLLFALVGVLFVGLQDRVEALEQEVSYVNSRFKEYDDSISAFSSYKSLGSDVAEGAPLPPGVTKKVTVKPIEGYYCAQEDGETYFLKLNKKGQVGYWIYLADAKVNLDELKPPTISGNYLINGGTIFVSIGEGNSEENRRGFVQKVDKRGYILQVELAGRLFSYSKCPNGLN